MPVHTCGGCHKSEYKCECVDCDCPQPPPTGVTKYCLFCEKRYAVQVSEDGHYYIDCEVCGLIYIE